MVNNSIKKRFSFNLISAIVVLITSLITNSIIPKTLGPNLYGSYGFVLSIYESFINFFKTGISQAYYNYNSQNNNSYYINRWVTIYFLLVIIILICLSVLSINFGQSIIWNDIASWLIYIVLCLVISREVFNLLNDYGHSKSLTIPIQKYKIIVLFIQILIIILLYIYNILDIISFCITSILLQFIFCYYSIRLYRMKNVMGNSPEIKNNSKYLELSKYFYGFSHPLVTLALFSTMAIFFDRWLLQSTSGSIDQAYYHFAQRLSVMILMINSAIIPIMQKEFVQIASQNDMDYLASKYVKYLKIFLFVISALVISIIFNIETLIRILLNENYMDASNVIIIIMISTIFRFFGQFYTILLISINKTKAIRNVGFITIICGFILTIILVGSNKSNIMIGLDLGANGLAIKLLSVEIINFIFMYLYVKKYLNIPRKLLLDCLKIVSFLTIVMYGLVFIINHILFKSLFASPIISSIISLVLFSLIIITFIFRYPNFIGISNNEKQQLINILLRKLKLVDKRI